MKRFITLVCATMLAVSCIALAGCGGSGAALKDGTYTGVGTGGKKGDVTVQVTVSGGKISAVEVTDNQETPERLQLAKDKVIPAIIEKQSVDGVDAASGATMSSNAIKDGVAKALEQAK